MAAQERNPEASFANMDPSLSQYVDLVDKTIDSPRAIFDDILTVEERYQQTNVINQGGMKKILKTTDSLTSRPVAKATLIDFEDSVKVENFLREARLTAALEHPNIIPVYDIGVDELEGPFFTMKLIGGQNLAEILKNLSILDNNRDYSLQELMEIFLKVCDAINYAHSKGIVHLDLKPENIQIGDYGEVLVCDWGLAKVFEHTESIIDFDTELEPFLYNGITLDGHIKGTPGYMAPEQIDTTLGPKNQQTDIYALGGILYSLLSYKIPFENDTLEGVLSETLVGDLLLPSKRAAHGKNIPPSLEAVAMKAMEIEPEKRYQSISELRNEVNKWMGGFATEAERASSLKSFWLLLNRHKAVSSLLFLLFFLAIFAIYQIKQNELKAMANEKTAIANEQKAIANEIKAKDALALYVKEKKLTGKINKYSVTQLIVLNEDDLNAFQFNKARENIVKSLGFQPRNETLNALKGEIHFYCQEFESAIASFKKSGTQINKAPYDKMFKLSMEYVKKKNDKGHIPAQDLVKLVTSFDAKYKSRLVAFEAKKYKLEGDQPFKDYLKEHPFLDDHFEFCRLMMISNGFSQSDKHFQYLVENDGISLDLSNSPKLEATKYLHHLPLKSLNVENTGFFQKWIFAHYYLKSVNIRNCGIAKITNETAHKLIHESKINKIIIREKLYSTINIKRISGLKNQIKFIVD